MAEENNFSECPLKVSVRIRPEKLNEKSILVLNEDDDKFLAVGDKPYVFDKIFGPTTTQEDIYTDTVKPFVEKLFQGYSCSVLAYGQTGTGKTYTMLGKNLRNMNISQDLGLVSRTVADVFQTAELTSNVTIEISFIEIYNQRIFDLLCKTRNEKSKWAIKNSKIEPYVFREVSMSNEALDLLDFGMKQRHVGSTNMNAVSSRSHTIFTIKCTIKNELSKQVSKLNLVDLGGTESIKRTGNEGMAKLEGININQSLFALRQVLKALSKNDRLIPFRDSLLTTVLHDSLTLRSYNILIACISPDVNDYQESINTLRFAESTKEIKSKPEIEVIMNNLKVQKPGNFEKSNQLLSSIIPTPLKMNNTVGTPGYKKPLVTMSKVNYSYNTPNCLKKIDYRKFANILDTTADLSSSTILENPLEPPVKRFKEATFSPIVRKCLEQLDNKLENIISRQLDTILKNKKLKGTPRKTSTPESNEKSQFSNLMHTVEAKVHELVTENLNRYHENYRKLAYTDKSTPRESLRRSARLSKVSKENTEHYGPRRTLFSRSIESEQTIKKLRRSIRLSNSLDVECITETPRDQPNPEHETGVELQPETDQISDQKETNRLSNLVDLPPDQGVFKMPQQSPPKAIKPRRSMRISNTFQTRLSILPPETPKPKVVRKRKLPVETTPMTSKRKIKAATKLISDSPSAYNNPARKRNKKEKIKISSHHERVLDILNNGSSAELMGLVTVGIKTANQIILSRSLHGKIESFDKLRDLPFWTTKQCDKFLTANYLI